MINWPYIFYNFLWIIGLALLLATFSLTHWMVEQEHKSFRQYLGEPPYRLLIAASFMLFALGLAFLSQWWGYKIGWLGVIGLSSWQGILAWQQGFGRRRRSRR